MTLDREFFFSYEAFDGRVIQIRNGNLCKIIGIGFVEVKIYNVIVRTLTYVRHVPYLKKNLISLSTLDAKGY